MEKKYLALLAAVAVIGAVAFVPANVAGEKIEPEEEDRFEIPLSKWIPSLTFEIEELLGIELNLDIGNYFIDLAELEIGVEEVNIGLILAILGFELDIILPVIIMSESVVTIFPPALHRLAEVFGPLEVTGLEIALSLMPFLILLSVGEFLPVAFILPLILNNIIPIIGSIIGSFIATIIDFPISVMFLLDPDEDVLAFNFNPTISLLAGTVILDPIEGIELEVEW